MGDFRDQLFFRDVMMNMVKVAVVTGISYYTISWIFKQMDPTNAQKKTAQVKAKTQLEKIGKNQLKLSEYESVIASHLVSPKDIPISWADIAGLEDVLEEITETVIFPIKKSSLLAGSKLTRPPKGVLLHGPPGCGKTLIAKATAKEAETAFINLDMSMLTDKWYGESQKLVTALFSLADKLQPCIIFIDEIDSLLRTRSSQDHEATAMMKAQFMFLWDGLITDPDKIVIVMGATNRPQDLDAAILRRMPSTFKIPMPDKKQRMKILKLVLEKEVTEGINYEELAGKTDKFSGSDLRELCRIGSLYRIREISKKTRTDKDNNTNNILNVEHLRAINMQDLNRALLSVNNKVDTSASIHLRDIKLD